jgi:undecaprenyl-diphosphatase
MSVLEAALLGLVQGVFMFVPVSSTSHLALTQHLLGAQGSAVPAPESPEMILFDIVVHVGTLVSIAVVMRRRLVQLASGLVEDLRLLRGRAAPGRVAVSAASRRVPDEDADGRPGAGRPRSGGSDGDADHRVVYLRLAGLGLVTVAVTGVLGLGVRAFGTEVFAQPALIAVTLAVTGTILWWTDRVGSTWRGVGQLSVAVAVGIGVAQAAALLPGLSRSGLTIAMALALGLHRPLAAEYSFIVAIPTILAAAGVQTLTVATSGPGAFQLGAAAYAVGFAVAAVVGIGALLLVLRLLYQARFRFFAVYVWLLAGAVALGAGGLA